MKKQKLEQLFIAYCKAAGLINERSRHEYPGKGINSKYIVAKPGTVFLTQSDTRAGSNWGIMVNGENGTVSTLYGYVSREKMAGYLEGVLKTKVNEQLYTVTNEGCDVMALLHSLPVTTFENRLALLIEEHYSADNVTIVYKGENRDYLKQYTATIFEDGEEEKEEVITLIPVAEY